MKKILSILIGVLLSTSGVFATDLTITAKLNIDNAGTVTLTDPNVWSNRNTTITTVTGDSRTASSSGGVFGIGKHSAKITVSVSESNTDYYFTGWTLPQALSSQTGTSWSYEVQHNSTSETHEITANFSPYWTISVTAIMAGDSESGVVTTVGRVKAKCHNATSISATLADGTLSSDVFSVTQSGSDSEGNSIFTIAYEGSHSLTDIVGKYVNVTLSSNTGKTKTVQVSVIEAATLTFRATDRGTYTVSSLFPSWDGTGSDQSKVIEDPAQLTEVPIILTADPKDGYIFWGWQIEEEGKVMELLREHSIKKTFTASATITPIFVPNTCGYMVMRDDGSTKRYTGEGLAGALLGSYNYWAFNLTALSMHYDLQEALNAASYRQIVVFENLATIFPKFSITRPEGFEQPSSTTEAVLPYRDGGYTIPENVVLLIPGDAIYSYSSNFRDLDQHRYQAHAALSTYRKLVVEQGTTINVEGDLCVSSVLTTGTNGGIRLGGSTASGILELQNNVHIDVQNGGNVFAYGYIINPQGTTITDGDISSVGRLTARNGATIHESFQIEDWRGGTAAIGMIGNEKKVFPINQYYIQNIEAPITFEYGSSENVATAATISSAKTLISTDVIVPKTATDQKAGLLIIGENCSLNKYYDYTNDRMMFHLKGTGLGSYSTIGNVSLPVSGQTIDSKAYVLGINNNIDIRISNITVDLPYSVNLFAGTNFQIDHDAKLIADANDNTIASIYLYDLEWSTRDGKGTSASTKPAGYFGMDEKTIALLSYRPGGFKTPRRTLKNDASMLVNGVLEIGEKGALYTTTLGTEGFSYGANIYSTGGGRIKFNNIGSDDVVHQAYQDGEENKTLNYFDIPVASAKLKNSNGEYTETSTSDKGKVYMYIDGTWQLPPWQLPTLLVTMPEQKVKGTVAMTIPEEYKSGSFTATINGDGFSFDEANTQKSKTIYYDSKMGANIEVDVYYTSLNQNGSHTATITLTHSTGGTYSNTLSATENYIPKFSVSPTELDLGETYINRPIEKGTPTFQISPQSEDNVTFLHDDDTYYSRLKWEAVSIKNSDNSDNTNFTFTPGEGKNALSGAKITFNSATPGTQSVKITLRATYTDASSPSQQINSEDVIINVTATAKALETNNFALTDECEQELMNMCVGIPVTLEFQGLTENTNLLDFDIANNGAVGSEVLTLSREGTVYTITATSVPANMPTITISQDPDGTYEGHITEAYTTNIQNCVPAVQWNWSDLYVGESYNTPYTTTGDGDVTLTLTKVTKAGVEVDANEVITYNPTTKTAAIIPGLTDEYEAIFTFQQAGTANFSPYTTNCTTAIYPRPNVLPVCVESEREFKGLTYASKDASFQEDNLVVFAANASWTMHFEGVPNVLSFTPTATTQLLVQESANGSTWDNTSLYEQVVADTPYEVELLPTTRYVKFTVVQASNLQNICVSEFANMVKADVEKLYMPISTDPTNNPTTHTITFTYNKDQEMQVMVPDGNFTATPNVLPATPEGYAQTTVTITSKATTEYNSNLRVVTISGATQTDQLIIPIETYRFPQKLPIQLENGKDDAKRFYYVTTLYKDVEWDAANYAINLKKRTSDVDDKPYVTFAFDGAPSFISFVPLVDNNLSNWEIKESDDGSIWNTPEQTPTLADGVLKQTLRHTARYVSVTYVGNNMDVVKMTKVNILTAQGAIPSVEELNLTEANKYTTELSVGADLNITTVNITNMTISVDNPNFTLSYGGITPATQFENISGIANVFGEDVVGELPFKVFWNAAVASDFATITITTQNGDEVLPLATVSLIGNANSITAEDEIWTGVDPTKHTLLGSFAGIDAIEGNDGIGYRKVKLENAYDEAGKALFDYLIIYGETTTTDGAKNITTPTTQKGSNAKTPMYVYMRVDDQYQFVAMEENVNSGTKMFSSLPVEAGTTVRVYITGFCPYASTGYTKADEGVWYFKGYNNANLEIYLDDCYIYSRNKTPDGHSFSGRGDGQSFTEAAVRGSGGVLVFENQDDDLDEYFNVTIHTNGNNMFKSTYGCFFELIEGLRVYQVSSPIQVHLAVDQEGVDYKNSGTILSFDDKWPTNSDDYSQTKRTNGRLSLQKQHNNAPSIDMGNSQTIVNFNGGQVELQNAAVVSQNYKTTFAISFRGGQFAGFDMALGIGTDDTGGTIRFNDGTTTVIPLWVDEVYKNYYLIDEENGEQVTRQYQGKTQYRTSCLRCPTDTQVKGGSHCMMRACSDPTSLGGAPKNASGDPLGLYRYPQHPATGHRGGWTLGDNKLVIPTNVPDGYGVASVTPNYGTNNVMDPIPGTAAECDDYLNFWFTEEQESSVKPEQEGNKYSYWKASVTKLKAEFMGYKREVGGPEDAQITEGEVVANLLYCQLDQNMHDVISEKDIDGNYTYEAPVKMPTDQLGYDYAAIKPSEVGEELQNYVVTVRPNPDVNAAPSPDPRDYEVLDKVYYIMPATADIWMTFVPPFDVEKLWVVETVDEQELIDYAATHTRQEVLKVQAKHNADFATFFAVTIALQYDKPFEQMYQEYLSWAREQDGHTGAASDYSKRGKIQLVHYNGNNWRDAHYYLYKNTENWEFDDESENYITKWQVVPEVAPGLPIMHQGEVYSFLLPYCQGCDVEANPDGTIKLDSNGLPITIERNYWDYWSGKLLIFESTQKSLSEPHKIKGENRHEEILARSEYGKTILTGNSTFSLIQTNEEHEDYVLLYTPNMNSEAYEVMVVEDDKYPTIQPTISFMKENLLSAISDDNQSLLAVTHSGKVIYSSNSGNGDNSETSVSHTPTIGGNNSLFVTATQQGINVAVSAPQYVRVFSATGSTIYSGIVQTAVDVAIPTTGVYVVAGESEVQKIWVE